MDTCICMAESLGCSPETITTLLVGCILIQNKKFKRKTIVNLFKKQKNCKNKLYIFFYHAVKYVCKYT